MSSTVPAPSILISGSSIAGPALAYWLNAHGWQTTVVERFDELRDDGQNIDVRGAGREVARRMGIEDAIRAASTGETGTEFVNADGSPVARFAAGESDSGGATAELEILRGQLSRIIVDRTRTDTTYVFGDRIVALDDGQDGVTVTFATDRSPSTWWSSPRACAPAADRWSSPASTPCASSASTSPT